MCVFKLCDDRRDSFDVPVIAWTCEGLAFDRTSLVVRSVPPSSDAWSREVPRAHGIEVNARGEFVG